MQTNYSTTSWLSGFSICLPPHFMRGYSHLIPSGFIQDQEKEIDKFVYELYGLTEEEIKIIENG